MLHSKDIFRKYDIRGIYGVTLTEELAEKTACSFARTVIKECGRENPLIAVGRDIRFSSDSLFEAVCRGLTDSGADVLDAGICPSPLTYFCMFLKNTDGYMMITGSHNPPEFNGIKVGTKNTVFHSDKILHIYNDIINNNFPVSPRKGSVTEYDVKSAYISFMKEHFKTLKEDISGLKIIKIVLDAGSGTASGVAPEIFRWLGVELYPLYCTPDGSFPGHHPDPTVKANMQEARISL